MRNTSQCRTTEGPVDAAMVAARRILAQRHNRRAQPVAFGHNRFVGEGRVEIVVNGVGRSLPGDLADPQMPLLWALRELLGLTGTKYGCGVAACGACTVHVDGQAVRSCVVPLASVAGKRIVTIEALGAEGRPHPLQRAWVAQQVPQCGYCQSGMLMAAAALLAVNRAPSDADIDAAVPNLCRCGTYQRVRAAIHVAAAELRNAGTVAGPHRTA